MVKSQSERFEVDRSHLFASSPAEPLADEDAIASPAEADAISPPESILSKLGTKSWRWLLLGLSTCCTLGGLAVWAFLWLTALPPLPNCQEISPLSPDMERLYCAQDAARSGKPSELVAGIKLLEQWTPDHPLHHEAQRWMADWSKSMLMIAREKVAQSDLKGAVELVSQIPKDSPIYAEAQTAIAHWQKQWKAGEAIYNKARTAIKHQDWQQASKEILALGDLNYDYWRVQQSNALAQQVIAEKQARHVLTQVRQQAHTHDPQTLQAAVKQLGTIDRKTFAWEEAQPLLHQWSQTLLTVGWQHWQARRLNQAIATANLVALDPKLSDEAKNLLTLSKARQLAMSTDSQWQTAPMHIFNLMEAIAAANQVKPDSRFYTPAQVSMKSWKAQLHDLTQLQFAQVTASLGQQDTLKLAIAQAKQIPPDHHRRGQAQTLAAHWSHEIEREADRPVLTIAEQLAQPDTIPALKAAIAQASKIPMGRVLRGEAQGLIYKWNRRIEAIEDQPFLDMARRLASQGRLSAAIQSAAVIRPGRVLYWQAQAAIEDWRAVLHGRQAVRLQPHPDAALMDQSPSHSEPALDKPLDQLTSPLEEAPLSIRKPLKSEKEPAPVPNPAPPLYQAAPAPVITSPSNGELLPDDLANPLGDAVPLVNQAPLLSPSPQSSTQSSTEIRTPSSSVEAH